MIVRAPVRPRLGLKFPPLLADASQGADSAHRSRIARIRTRYFPSPTLSIAPDCRRLRSARTPTSRTVPSSSPRAVWVIPRENAGALTESGLDRAGAIVALY